MQKTLTRLKEIVDECEKNPDTIMPLLKCPMVEVTRPESANSIVPNSELCFFAGSGFDSLISNVALVLNLGQASSNLPNHNPQSLGFRECKPCNEYILDGSKARRYSHQS